MLFFFVNLFDKARVLLHQLSLQRVQNVARIDLFLVLLARVLEQAWLLVVLLNFALALVLLLLLLHRFCHHYILELLLVSYIPVFSVALLVVLLDGLLEVFALQVVVDLGHDQPLVDFLFLHLLLLLVDENEVVFQVHILGYFQHSLRRHTIHLGHLFDEGVVLRIDG